MEHIIENLEYMNLDSFKNHRVFKKDRVKGDKNVTITMKNQKENLIKYMRWTQIQNITLLGYNNYLMNSNSPLVASKISCAKFKLNKKENKNIHQDPLGNKFITTLDEEYDSFLVTFHLDDDIKCDIEKIEFIDVRLEKTYVEGVKARKNPEDDLSIVKGDEEYV